MNYPLDYEYYKERIQALAKNSACFNLIALTNNLEFKHLKTFFKNIIQCLINIFLFFCNFIFYDKSNLRK